MFGAQPLLFLAGIGGMKIASSLTHDIFITIVPIALAFLIIAAVGFAIFAKTDTEHTVEDYQTGKVQ